MIVSKLVLLETVVCFCLFACIVFSCCCYCCCCFVVLLSLLSVGGGLGRKVARVHFAGR